MNVEITRAFMVVLMTWWLIGCTTRTDAPDAAVAYPTTPSPVRETVTPAKTSGNDTADPRDSKNPEHALLAMPVPGDFETPLHEVLKEAIATVRARPRDDQSWGDLAMLCHAHGLNEEARTAYRVAKALDPLDSLWPHLLGVVCETLSLPDEALEALQVSRELEPYDLVARCIMGRIYQSRGDVEEARKAFLEAVEIDVKSVAARVGLGQLALRSGALESARQNLKWALDEYPECGPAHSAMAEVYEQQGNDEKAAFHRRWSLACGGRMPLPDRFMQDIERRGVTHPTRLKLGKSAAAQRAWPEAISHYQAARDLRPQSAEAGRLLGLALVYGGRPDEGLKELERVSALDGNPEDALLATTRVHLAQRALPKARAVLERALERDEVSAAAFILEGNLCRAEGKPEEALAAYEHAIVAAPENARALVAKAELLLSQRAPREAAREDSALRERERARVRSIVKLCENAVELQGNLARGYNTAGQAHMQLWEFSDTPEEKTANVDAAIGHFRTLATYFPERKAGHVALIRALHAAGRGREAFKAIQKAQQLWPTDQQFLPRRPEAP